MYEVLVDQTPWFEDGPSLTNQVGEAPNAFETVEAAHEAIGRLQKRGGWWAATWYAVVDPEVDAFDIWVRDETLPLPKEGDRQGELLARLE